MFRTALRLGTLPLLAALVVLLGEGIPFWQWFAIVFLSPFVLGLLLCSFWRLKRNPVEGAVPRWAQKVAPYVWGVSILVILSVPLTSWPLHLSFRRSKPQLELLLAQARAGKKIALPQSAGAFEILDVDVDYNGTSFYLTNEDGESPTTLIYSPPSKSSENWSQSHSVVILNENWVYSEPFD